MVNVYLHGMVGRKFGKIWEGLKVSSASEAFHAIDVNTNGEFRAYFAQNPEKKYKIKVGKNFIQENVEATGPCGKQEIHILPVIKGRNSGFGKVFAAIAIVALMAWNPLGWAYATSYGAGFGGLTAAAGAVGGLTGAGLVAGGVAASLFLGGVSQLLSPKVGFATTTDASHSNSSNFAGNVGTVLQGNAVPVAYGRVLISPLPISISLIQEDYTVGGTNAIPDVTTNGDSSFDIGNGSPPINPVGQNVKVTSNNNLYLDSHSNTTSNTNLGPQTIPPSDAPYPGLT